MDIYFCHWCDIVNVWLDIRFRISYYKKAESLLASGNYKEARTIYQVIENGGSYKESYLDLEYALANQFVTDGNYLDAAHYLIY